MDFHLASIWATLCWCCCGAGLTLLAFALLWGRARQTVPGAPAKPSPASPAPTSPIAKSGIRFPGGRNEWRDLTAQIDLQVGETAETLVEKAELMIVFIQTLERAVFLPLCGLAEGARYYVQAHQLPATHPAVVWATDCKQMLAAWETDFQDLRARCLTGGRANSAALDCLVDGVVDWLGRIEPLREALAALLPRVDDPALAGHLTKLQERWLTDLQEIRNRLQARDISWMRNLPRTTFGRVEDVQRLFAAHFGPSDQPQAILPVEHVIDRRPGKIWLSADRVVEFGFGAANGEEYLQFSITNLGSRFSAGFTTNYRIYPSGKKEKLAPWICDKCGMSVEAGYVLCGECGADELAYLAWGQKD